MLKVGFLKARSSADEVMDTLSVPGECFASSFRFIRLVNDWFGWIRTTLGGLEALLLHWDKSRPVRLLDVGCGCGDMILAMARWGQRHGYRFNFSAIDIRADFLELAREKTEGLEVDFSVQDVLEDPLPRADIVHCAMTLHHLEDQQIRIALRRLMTAARWGIVVNDLNRSLGAYAGCWCLTRFFSDSICRRDALESVRRGFTPSELHTLLKDTGINGTIQSHWWFRLSITIRCDDHPALGSHRGA